MYIVVHYLLRRETFYYLKYFNKKCHLFVSDVDIIAAILLPPRPNFQPRRAQALVS